MRIVKVDCDFLLIAVPIPVKQTTREYGVLLVTIETDTGLVGHGFAREHDFQSLSVRQLILNDIGPFLKSLDDFGTPGFVWHEASYELPRSDYRVTTGIYSRAASAIDQALWDIWGQACGQPIYRLLGGSQPEVDIYATFGLNIYTPEEETEAARRMMALGFTAFKLQGAHAKRGTDTSVDAARVKRLRETVGESARIMIDGRNEYPLYYAIELAKKIEPYNVAYFDEPLFARDPESLKRLSQAVPGVPLAGRSLGGNIWDNRDLILSNALSVMGANVLDQGGFTQSVKVAHMAEMFQMPMVVGGSWHLQNAHLIAGVTNGWMTEYTPLAASVGDTIFVDPLKPEKGRFRLSDKPGFGLTLNEAGVRESRERARTAAKKRG